jgi:hypothetical protein
MCDRGLAGAHHDLHRIRPCARRAKIFAHHGTERR